MIIIAYGTRPEFIKLYPLIIEAKKENLSYKIIKGIVNVA